MCDWNEDSFLDLKELEDQITKFVDNSNIEEMLRIQLNELEMLESMFSNPGEFSVYDYSVVVDINDFLDGKRPLLPPCLDFTIKLTIECVKLEVCVNLPHDYPTTEPDVFVRNDQLGRTSQHELNSDLAGYISTLDRGEICICAAVSWLQENASAYFNKDKGSPLKKHNSAVEDKKSFMRYWIYSHHIYSKAKRREILDLAQEYNVTGFSLPGRPGIICGEGWNVDCEDWWQKIKCLNWKKIMCKKKEEFQLNGLNMDDLRKFKGFNEISFENTRPKSRDAHMDMGEFFRYLSEHECGYVFKDYFGVDGKTGASIH